MDIVPRFAKLVVWSVLVMSVSVSAVNAQSDTRTALFSEADEMVRLANDMQANVLAPKAYDKALEHYQKAEENFTKGKSIADIRKELKTATSGFQSAVDATKLANLTLSSAISARNGAVSAEAPKFAADMWQKASKKFAEAAGTLEDGDVNGARKKGEEAQRLFRDAELAAIKVNYLSETWSLLSKAEQLEVKKYAPKSLKVARSLAAQAEKELNENRYDSDAPRSLAKQPNYEAKHAIYLANTFKELEKRKNSWEDLVLAAEKPLAKVAANLDLRATFDTGFDESVILIIDEIKALQTQNRRLSQELADRTQQIALQDERIEELEEKIGGIEQEKSALAQRMEQGARIRQRFTSVEKLFEAEEAVVLRQGRDITIRLVGLNFGVAQSTIEPQYFALLTRVQQAIRTFPDATITIEGHTDSYGSDETNLALSNDRAQAVRQYILANMGLDRSQVSAVGYGESRPIASNETEEGRAKNRRIDLVIHPNSGGTS
jgi:outer membrane protein OmpA-like peptidoglycan-associated protein